MCCILLEVLNEKNYLRFKSNDENFGRHTGHIVKENSISSWTSAKATSKYDRAARKKIKNLHLES